MLVKIGEIYINTDNVEIIREAMLTRENQNGYGGYSQQKTKVVEVSLRSGKVINVSGLNIQEVVERLSSTVKRGSGTESESTIVSDNNTLETSENPKNNQLSEEEEELADPSFVPSIGDIGND